MSSRNLVQPTVTHYMLVLFYVPLYFALLSSTESPLPAHVVFVKVML